jgi:hypothetical protein
MKMTLATIYSEMGLKLSSKDIQQLIVDLTKGKDGPLYLNEVTESIVTYDSIENPKDKFYSHLNLLDVVMRLHQTTDPDFTTKADGTSFSAEAQQALQLIREKSANPLQNIRTVLAEHMIGDRGDGFGVGHFYYSIAAHFYKDYLNALNLKLKLKYRGDEQTLPDLIEKKQMKNRYQTNMTELCQFGISQEIIASHPGYVCVANETGYHRIGETPQTMKPWGLN